MSKSKKKDTVPPIDEELIAFGGKDAGVLERFLKEQFDFAAFKKAGFFTKEMRNDYYAQAKRICIYFGYKSVFEYGAEEIRCHISYVEGHRPISVDENGDLKTEPFVTVIPSIYE
jgi:hypothetical protein